MATDAQPLESSLCEKCKGIFHGEWVERQPNDVGSNKVEANEGAFSESELETSDFYERPRFGKREDSECVVCTHHTVPELESSSEKGCLLCAMIYDRLSESKEDLSKHDHDALMNAVGVIVVFPHEVESDVEDEVAEALTPSISFEVSFFVNGCFDDVQAYVPTTCVFELISVVDFPEVVSSNVERSIELPTATVNTITEWIQECQNEHVDCWRAAEFGLRTDSNSTMPTRLLDVSDSHLRLCERDSLDRSEQYITLSHCWGALLPARLTSSTHGEFLKEIQEQKLPRTFRDAVSFTRILGIRYLWIDALCIIQDSREDWLHESALMAKVYSFSYVNLAATASVDGHGGLLRSRDARLAVPCIIEAKWTPYPAGRYICIDESAYSRRVGNGPLNQRGWVLQERILSPRTVHFARDQVWWECRRRRSCEVFPEGVPGPIMDLELSGILILVDLDSQDELSASGAWLDLIVQYTQTKMTKDSDRLVALAGMATVFQRALGWQPEDFVFGLWKQDLLVNLLWRMRATGSRKQNSYVAPSWSWASVNGAVHFVGFENRLHMRDNMCAEIIEIDVATVGGPYGPATAGSITLQTNVHPITLSEPSLGRQATFANLHVHGEHCGFQLDDFWEAMDDEALYNNSKNSLEAFWCPIADLLQDQDGAPDSRLSHGLILQSAAAEIPGTYVRIGRLAVWYKGKIPRLDTHNKASFRYLERSADGQYIIRII